MQHRLRVVAVSSNHAAGALHRRTLAITVGCVRELIWRKHTTGKSGLQRAKKMGDLVVTDRPSCGVGAG
jgi:hypothetical protein